MIFELCTRLKKPVCHSAIAVRLALGCYVLRNCGAGFAWFSAMGLCQVVARGSVVGRRPVGWGLHSQEVQVLAESFEGESSP